VKYLIVIEPITAARLPVVFPEELQHEAIWAGLSGRGYTLISGGFCYLTGVGWTVPGDRAVDFHGYKLAPQLPADVDLITCMLTHGLAGKLLRDYVEMQDVIRTPTLIG
jgi:hypothetical protein